MEIFFDHIALQVSEITAAVAWYRDSLPQTTIHYQDESWALIEAHGARIAFVLKEQHPAHLAYRVSAETLADLAANHKQEIRTHRDGSRGFYLEGPSGQSIEFITFPEPK